MRGMGLSFWSRRGNASLVIHFLGPKGEQQLVLGMLCRQVGPYRFHKDLAGGPVPWTTTDEADDQSQEAHG